MNPLYLLQFACLIFMLINAFILAMTHLHVSWKNKRYERSRGMILIAMIGLALQYFMQMFFGFRATDANLGAIINILIYTPCFTLISMGIYNIEATHANRRKFHFVCSVIYIAIIAIFALSSYLNQGLYIGKWLYVMLALYFGNVVYCIYMIVQEMIKRKNMLETMAASDMLPYVRYARSSVVILFLAALIMPFAILSNTLLFIAGPFGLLALLFFNLNFVALGSSYTPTEELLDKEEEQEEAIKANAKRKKAKSEEKTEESNDNEMDDINNTPQLPEERRKFIQESLDRWCAKMGYKDSAANMLTLSSTLHISKNELSIYFDQCLKSTFRIWLSEIRFNAAKQMMTECPDYSNDIVSAECGFSSALISIAFSKPKRAALLPSGEKYIHRRKINHRNFPFAKVERIRNTISVFEQKTRKNPQKGVAFLRMRHLFDRNATQKLRNATPCFNEKY